MGLLDSLFQDSGYGGQGGGLLDYLNGPLYQSPLLKKQEYSPYAGINTAFDPTAQQPTNPFPAPPQAAPQPASNAVFGQVPNLGPQPAMMPTPSVNSMGQAPGTFPNYAPPPPAAPPLPPPQAVAPTPGPQMQNPQQDQGPINTMDIGGYQMPQFGTVADYMPKPATAPSQAPTDVSAQSRQQQALPPALGGNSFGGRLGAGLQSFANAGSPIQALAGGITGLLTGQRSDAVGIQQQNLNAQYQSIRQTLEANGESKQAASSKAMIAVMNPEAAKTILPELFTNKEKLVMRKDGFGNEVPYWVNERDQTYRRAEESSAQGGAAASGDMQAITDRMAKLRESGATREQLLQQIPSGYRDDVEALVTGKAVPANMGRAQVRGTLNILAHAVDKNYDEQMISARVQMRKDFAGEGKNGQAIGAFNTVQHHAGQVSDAIAEFEKAGGGSDYPLWNATKLMVANNTGADPKLRDAAQKLQDKLNATEHEVASAYNSGHITDSDRKTWNEIKASNLPANQLKQKLADFVELLNGKRDSLNHMHQQMFHEDAPTIDKETNAAITSKIQQRLPDYAKPENAIPNLKVGQTVTIGGVTIKKVSH